jgi:tRNA threonylcarbamoyladenosine biosynthesis protein TsaE
MSNKISEYRYNLNEIELILPEFWEKACAYTVLAFGAEMGVGKTTFIHRLCDWLGVTDSVSSPTFALINEYHFDNKGRDTIIWHMDWYRIKSEEELVTSGIEDTMIQAGRTSNYCFVEWPEKAPGMLPANTLWVHIELQEDMSRKMVLSTNRP